MPFHERMGMSDSQDLIFTSDGDYIRHLVVLSMFDIGGDSPIRLFFLVGGYNAITHLISLDPPETLNTIAGERITGI
jgi:hypothetical protein